MIVREEEQQFVMVAQHDHARLSGDLAGHFSRFFTDDPHFDDVLLAIYNHDLSWVRLDEAPIWNDRKSAPYSFTDYPLLPKLTHYEYGLNQTERLNKYAALLCSMHYSSFGIFQNSVNPACQDFSREEARRQHRIMAELGVTNDALLDKQLKLLQLCDRISLYVCLNRPGSGKDQENARYKAGFEDSELFTDGKARRLIAQWVNDNEIRLTPSPFETGFHACLRQKRVPKELIRKQGIEHAYRSSEWVDQHVYFAGCS